MFVNLQHSVEVYWKDTNTNLTNSTSHPINAWTKSESPHFTVLWSRRNEDMHMQILFSVLY